MYICIYTSDTKFSHMSDASEFKSIYVLSAHSWHQIFNLVTVLLKPKKKKVVICFHILQYVFHFFIKNCFKNCFLVYEKLLRACSKKSKIYFYFEKKQSQKNHVKTKQVTPVFNNCVITIFINWIICNVKIWWMYYWKQFWINYIYIWKMTNIMDNNYLF